MRFSSRALQQGWLEDETLEIESISFRCVTSQGGNNAQKKIGCGENARGVTGELFKWLVIQCDALHFVNAPYKIRDRTVRYIKASYKIAIALMVCIDLMLFQLISVQSSISLFIRPYTGSHKPHF